MNACKQHLVGRRIVAVEWHTFKTGIKEQVSTRPVLTLDSGRTISFAVDETEIGEYGVRIVASAAPMRKRHPDC